MVGHFLLQWEATAKSILVVQLSSAAVERVAILLWIQDLLIDLLARPIIQSQDYKKLQ